MADYAADKKNEDGLVQGNQNPKHVKETEGGGCTVM